MFICVFVFGIVLVVVVVVVVMLAGAAVAAVVVLVASFCVAHAVMEQRTSVLRVRFMPRDSTTEAPWTHPMQIF